MKKEKEKKDDVNELDVTLKEYKEAGNLYDDYRNGHNDFWATCDFDFLKNLMVGDELHLTNEETGNLAPFVHTIELEDDDNNYRTKMLKVTRKIYSPTSLDVYVEFSDEEEFDD